MSSSSGGNGIEVRGLAYLDGNIYIIQGGSKSIGVYRTEDNYLVKEIRSDRFDRLLDIVVCNSILYGLDQSYIWQIDNNSNVSEYVSLSQVSATMSASVRETRLLVTSSRILSKYTYRPIGKPAMSKIRLPEGLMTATLWHAQEIADGHVIAHVETGKFHRVSKIEESESKRAILEVCAYGNEAGNGNGQLSNPVYLALEPEHGHIFVADHDNQRVVVLDRNLSRVMLISALPTGSYPNRLCYVDERKELFVGMSNGYIIGYKFTW